LARIIERTGDSVSEAIVILDAEDEVDGVAVEYEYLARKFGNKGRYWTLKHQSLVVKGHKHCGRVDIVLSDGRERTLYFDITDFSGKLPLGY